MGNAKLDSVDHQLISELIVDGRASYVTLASRVRLSPAAVRARVKRLIDERVVTVTARVDPGTLGDAVFAFALVRLDGPSQDVARRIGELREAVFIGCVSGRWSLLVELRCRDSHQLVLTLDRIRTTPGVAAVESVPAIEYFKQVWTGIVHDVLGRRDGPVRANPVLAERPLDAVDRALLAGLIEDGRASYAALAALVGLSQAAVRARVQRLLEEGVVVVQAYASAEALDLAAFGAAFISARGEVIPLSQRLVAMPETTLVTATSGRYDLVCELWCRDDHHLLATLDALRGLPGVRSVESCTYLDIVKEQYQVDAAT
ncbi:MAG: Lrp/AsnC family transcriptional regulator [Thermoleophilia bacterium]|nr:Lrp/AsnC family transcriptional regulator [Thermoleophilia bacterium]